jgi:hypothetical protein
MTHDGIIAIAYVRRTFQWLMGVHIVLTETPALEPAPGNRGQRASEESQESIAAKVGKGGEQAQRFVTCDAPEPGAQASQRSVFLNACFVPLGDIPA